jgi:hypothetical protein
MVGSAVLFGGGRHIYMQHHSFGHRFASSVCGLRVDVAAEGPVTVAGCPGRGDGAVDVWAESLESHKASKGCGLGRRVRGHLRWVIWGSHDVGE